MAAKKNNSWIKLYRSLVNNEIWHMEPFSRGQAWVDLLLMVCYEDTETTHRGNLIHISKGSIRTSIDYLSKRWQRSTKWTRNTLEILRGKQMVTLRGTTQGTIITVENYAFYQGQGQTKGQTKDTTKDTTEGRANKNNKEINKEIGANGSQNDTFFAPVTRQESEERYVEIKDTNGKTYIYDTKEERYVD